jgi:hypothetical protein
VPSAAAPAAKTRAPDAEAPAEIWERARLQYNRQNGTLTATGPNNAKAYAYDERGAELLSRLPAELQQRVRTKQFMRTVARVRGSELIDVEVKS